jgi:hypothetical protein
MASVVYIFIGEEDIPSSLPGWDCSKRSGLGFLPGRSSKISLVRREAIESF